MATTDVLNILIQKIKHLEKSAREVERVGKDFFQKVQIRQSSENSLVSPSPFSDPPKPHIVYQWEPLDDNLKKLQRKVIRKYQNYYSSACQFIKEYLPERESEFIERYHAKYGEGILACLQLETSLYNNDKSWTIQTFEQELEIQRSILLSIPDVAEIKELTLRKVISADVAKTQIEQAEVLFEKGFSRAGGVIAGVALELYLKTLCDVNRITYGPKDTIDPIATKLYTDQILDITELNHMKRLASIRNKCAHGDQISEGKIKILIEEVRKLV